MMTLMEPLLQREQYIKDLTAENARLRAALDAILAEEQFELVQWSRDTRLKIIQAQPTPKAAAQPDCDHPFKSDARPDCVATDAESEEK